MGCGSTGAVLDRVVDWSVLTTEVESWLAGFGCTAACLDFLRGGSPPAAIATARAEGLRRRFERFGGILSLQKNSEKTTRYYPKRYSYSENKRLTETQSWEKTKRSGKESLSDKQSTQQLPSYAKINLDIKIDNSHKAKLYKQQWTNPH